ncbi:MAG TPA: DUF2330 domain-containing protein [Actinomycetota bacterium]|nr:DUF2330 domain-containing protein [Actinomycetota bacterium]
MGLNQRSRRRSATTTIRVLAVGSALGLLVLIGAGPALACGGLIGPNGGVSLQRTTTLVGYHNGVEHYITAFTFEGGTGNFGSITPLPAVPTAIEKGGAWTLQRLVRETEPINAAFDTAGRAAAAAAPVPAQVIQQTTIGALDLTVLKGGGFAVGEWAKNNGFSLPPDAPALLDFYAHRSPIFMAAKFNADAAAAQGQQAGAITPIALTIPTKQPWVPLAILGLGKTQSDFVSADIYLLTDQAPAMLPDPTPLRSNRTSTNGLVLNTSEQASASLISDLREDQGGSWIPASGMWLTYLRLSTPEVNLRYDLSVGVNGVAPSARAAGLASNPAPSTPTPPSGGGSAWVWWASALGAAGLAAAWGWSWRRSLRVPGLPA